MKLKAEFKRYIFNQHTYSHYINCNRVLNTTEQEILAELLLSFPHCSSNWLDKFLLLDCAKYDKDILCIAANAFDKKRYGNTVLGVACEYGKSVEAVQKLIDMGANVDTPDYNMNKLALHWAIANKISFFNKTSFEAVEVVKCLLKNGARTDIVCYDNTTPLGYARSRGYEAAAILIKQRDLAYRKGLAIGLFKDIFPADVCRTIADSLNYKADTSIALTRNDTIPSAKEELSRFLITF